MRPFDALHDPRNSRAGDAILCTKGPIPYASGIALSYPANICCGQPCGIVVFPAMIVVRAAAGLSAFSDLVCGIIGCRPEKQMRRIDAGRVVAAMADQHAARDMAEVQLPRKPMRRHHFAVYKKALVYRRSTTLVGPASGSLLHLAPEPLLRQPIASGVRAGAATKARSVGSDVDRQRVILSTAVKTIDRWLSHKRNLTQVASALQGWATA